MPEISRFLGIIITMYYNNHPPPHFHVRYNQQKAIIDIQNLSILVGKLTPRVFGLVIEWAAILKDREYPCYDDSLELPKLVKYTAKKLKLTPENHSNTKV